MHDFRFRKTNWLKSVGLAALLAVLCPAHAAEKTTYFHFDALGSPVAATDQAGNVVWKEEYRPYGARIKQEPAAGSNTRWYTGHPQDDDTGLTYAGARYYDPVAGRFMGIDPKGFDEANIHSFNRYAYANNNPYKFVDPDGEVGILVFVAAVVVLSVGDALVDGVIDATFGSTPAVGSGEIRSLSTLPGPASSSAVLGKIGLGTLRNTLSKSKSVVTKNKVRGDAFRDEIADRMQKAGREVQTEVSKKTPFGKRVIDIEVRKNGKPLGGIETKTGRSRYRPSQRAKDEWLRRNGYPVDLVRDR